MSEDIIDYAYPCMMAEKAMKDLHNSMLHENFDEAAEHALTAMANIKLTYNAIRYAKEAK